MELVSCHPSLTYNFEAGSSFFFFLSFFENLYTPALRLTNAKAVKAQVSIVTGYRKDVRQQTRGVCTEINTLSSVGQFVIL
jgi:hypothetical protein